MDSKVISVIKNLGLRRSLYYAFLHLAIVILGVQVFLLSRQIRELKGEGGSPSRPNVAVGDYFTLANLRSIDPGIEIDSTSEKQLLFIFTTSCPFCKKNVSNWKEIISWINSDRIKVFGISLDSKDKTVTYVRDQELNFPVLIPNEINLFKENNRVYAVPQTVVRSSAGFVGNVWRGLMREKDLKEIQGAILSPVTKSQNQTN